MGNSLVGEESRRGGRKANDGGCHLSREGGKPTTAVVTFPRGGRKPTTAVVTFPRGGGKPTTAVVTFPRGGGKPTTAVVTFPREGVKLPRRRGLSTTEKRRHAHEVTNKFTARVHPRPLTAARGERGAEYEDPRLASPSPCSRGARSAPGRARSRPTGEGTIRAHSARRARASALHVGSDMCGQSSTLVVLVFALGGQAVRARPATHHRRPRSTRVRLRANPALNLRRHHGQTFRARRGGTSSARRRRREGCAIRWTSLPYKATERAAYRLWTQRKSQHPPFPFGRATQAADSDDGRTRVPLDA